MYVQLWMWWSSKRHHIYKATYKHGVCWFINFFYSLPIFGFLSTTAVPYFPVGYIQQDCQQGQCPSFWETQWEITSDQDQDSGSKQKFIQNFASLNVGAISCWNYVHLERFMGCVLKKRNNNQYSLLHQ